MGCAAGSDSACTGRDCAPRPHACTWSVGARGTAATVIPPRLSQHSDDATHLHDSYTDGLCSQKLSQCHDQSRCMPCWPIECNLLLLLGLHGVRACAHSLAQSEARVDINRQLALSSAARSGEVDPLCALQSSSTFVVHTAYVPRRKHSNKPTGWMTAQACCLFHVRFILCLHACMYAWAFGEAGRL